MVIFKIPFNFLVLGKMFKLILAFIMVINQSSGLDNGLALTPPMGWLSWERFRCNIDCDNDPENCIDENLFKTMADEMVIQGFKDVGYEYVIIDDCWLAHERDSEGRLQPDPVRFPSGIKALANYIHKLGLKLGIYEDYGNFTCAGYPGILGHLEIDAQTFASWDIDYIKVDGCYADNNMDTGYPEFGKYLNETGRAIVYSCSWPAYQSDFTDYEAVAEHCNLWRNYGDIQDSWSDVLNIMDHYADIQDLIAPYAGPGHWNDPDMLIIGNYALSVDQAQVQMAMWAILASPLIMSNDLRTIRPEFKEILQNKNVIKVNQDPLGIQGRRIKHDTNLGLDVFVKPVMPLLNGKNSSAVAFVYRGTFGTPTKVTFTPRSIGLEYNDGYLVSDLFSEEDFGWINPDDTMTIYVNPNGVRLLRFDVESSNLDTNNLLLHSSKTINIFKAENVGLNGYGIEEE